MYCSHFHFPELCYKLAGICPFLSLLMIFIICERTCSISPVDPILAYKVVTAAFQPLVPNTQPSVQHWRVLVKYVSNAGNFSSGILSSLSLFSFSPCTTFFFAPFYFCYRNKMSGCVCVKYPSPTRELGQIYVLGRGEQERTLRKVRFRKLIHLHFPWTKISLPFFPNFRSYF